MAGKAANRLRKQRRREARALTAEFRAWLETAPQRMSAIDLIALAPPHLRPVAAALVETMLGEPTPVGISTKELFSYRYSPC